MLRAQGESAIMQNAADGVERFEEYDDSFGTIVSNLISLVEQVQASIDLIEGAIARETTVGDQDNSQDNSNVIVLDDVTPQYMKASIALNKCSINLGTALQFLLDARASARRPGRLFARG
jgi:hypothetical protein